MRDRAQRIRLAAPDVALAVTLEIDGVFEVARGHELRLAHRARPGPAHSARRDVAVLENAHGGEKLVAPEVALVVDIAERRQRIEHVLAAVEGAELGFDAPNPHDRAGVDAIGRLGPRQDVARGGVLPLAGDDAGRNDRAGEIGPDRNRELGLNLGVGGDLGVVVQALDGLVEGLAADPLGLRQRPEVLRPFGEAGGVGIGERGGGGQREGEAERERRATARLRGDTVRRRDLTHAPPTIGDPAAIVHRRYDPTRRRACSAGLSSQR